ncbi:MAG: type II toxin-antitoxin system VapC family toxin [Euzebya sp.]
MDSSVALRAAQSSAAAVELTPYDLIAPPIWRSETLSALHEAQWRREVDDVTASRLRQALQDLRVRIVAPRRLYDVAWHVAEELGWAKTYDSEFLALARIRGTKVLTTDARMYRGAIRTGLVVNPDELTSGPRP